MVAKAERNARFLTHGSLFSGIGGDTMTCTCPDAPRYRTLGNAVAVPVAEWIAQRLVAALRSGGATAWEVSP